MPGNLRLKRLAGWMMAALIGSSAIAFSNGAHAATDQRAKPAPHHAAAPAHAKPTSKSKPKPKAKHVKAKGASKAGAAHAAKAKGGGPAHAAHAVRTATKAQPHPTTHAKKAPAGAKGARTASAKKGGVHARQDLSGRKRVGKASFYARHLEGRKMADGTRMRLHDDNAASKTLPLGTTARVTNLENGKSAKVTIQDRGPYAKDRIVDLSPGTAQKIGIDKQNGVATVEVQPLSVPMPDGSVKQASGADKAGR